MTMQSELDVNALAEQVAAEVIGQLSDLLSNTKTIADDVAETQTMLRGLQIILEPQFKTAVFKFFDEHKADETTDSLAYRAFRAFGLPMETLVPWYHEWKKQSE